MTRLASEPRPFIPGTTGWTAADLENPHVEQEWFSGRYEIIDGVLTTKPAAYFDSQFAVENLIFLNKTHMRSRGESAAFAPQVDIIIDPKRVVRADAVYMTPADRRAQAAAARREGRRDLTRTRILVPPTLIIESLSPGHEQHDEDLKRRWYAEFGVPNYWLLNAFNRSLRCLVLHEGAYRADASGRNREKVRPHLFPGLAIPLTEVWDEFQS